uniref:Putative secreted protein n=1 Tax=Ixodes ricinus TaxID=34613 RepID=A0A6B0UP62_IXORI
MVRSGAAPRNGWAAQALSSALPPVRGAFGPPHPDCGSRPNRKKPIQWHRRAWLVRHPLQRRSSWWVGWSSVPCAEEQSFPSAWLFPQVLRRARFPVAANPRRAAATPSSSWARCRCRRTGTAL